MPSYTFYLVDVFAQAKCAGNQLAVVVNADKLSSEDMQKIANEMHFSETTFIQSHKRGEAGYNVRIFTPATEVPFAGHPTLGTAYIIKHFVAEEPTAEVTLNLKVGQIHVKCEQVGKEEILWMKQMQPVFGKKFACDFFRNLLGLTAEDFDTGFPIQEVSTGLPFVIVPLKTLDAVKKARVNHTLLPAFLQQVQAGILVFSPETYSKENNLNVRVFVDAFGTAEDPATGSGNGCLAAYLAFYKYFGSRRVDARLEQGFEIRRPSILLIKAEHADGKFDVQVGGNVLLIGKGKFL